MDYEEQRIKKLISKQRWQKTNYIDAHEYTITYWNLKLKEDFNYFVRTIREYGVSKRFLRKYYNYLSVDDYEYWVVGEGEMLINRRIKRIAK